jgi:radical SAM protein with 4Fe4S-binding SPASM domain
MRSVPLVSRDNELTAVLRRDLFDVCPGDVTSAVDVQRWHTFRAAYHQAQHLNAQEAWPLQVDFELNSTCNLTCTFCIHGQQTVEKRVLPREVFERVVLEGEQHGLCSIKLNYINEPLLVRDLPDCIRFAKAHGVLNVYFATNGVLLSERMANALIDAGLSKVMVSLDATTSATFAIMRQSTQFDLILRNIDTFLRVRAQRNVTWPLLRVNFLKTPLNIHEADAFVSYWTGRADAIGLQDEVGMPGVENELTSVDAALFREHAQFGCAFPFKLVVIDSAGQILPCCTFSGRSMPIGHTDTDTVATAWNSPKMLALRALHARYAYAENPICRHCVGSCRPEAQAVPLLRGAQ